MANKYRENQTDQNCNNFDLSQLRRTTRLSTPVGLAPFYGQYTGLPLSLALAPQGHMYEKGEKMFPTFDLLLIQLSDYVTLPKQTLLA